jgi:hypothetical protein
MRSCASPRWRQPPGKPAPCTSGDIGLCAIEGFIDRNVVYSCGGGDGPAGWDTVSVLDGDSGESQVIRDCRFDEEGTHCTVDLLHLGG